MTSATPTTGESEPFSYEVPPPETLSFDGPSPSSPSTLSPGTLCFEIPAPETRLDAQSAFERRERRRESLRVQARICLDGESPLEAHTVDLSPHGLAITTTHPLNVNQECNIELGISVPGLATSPALRASVRYCARLREDSYRIGMKFTAVSIEAAELIAAALDL
jgi:hypothetical protein